MKSHCLFILFSVSIFIGYGQNTTKHTISGYVREKGSAELLIGVSVQAPQYNTGSQSNNYGFYSITLPETDSLELIFTYFGYVPQKHVFKLDKDIDLNVSIRSDTVVMDEVVIKVDDYQKQSDNAKISCNEIPVQQVKQLPALLGEKDVFKVLQLMPGVKKGSEGNSGLYVRGGGPDQNLIILDDATVYNAFHLFGFFSIFNGDAIKSIELIKGGFPARYGGRLSSVVEMNMKEGNKEQIHGEFGIGILSSRLTLEGPLKKGKSSFLISARRTYFDLFTYPLLPKDHKAGYNFHDFNLKLNYDLGQKNKLYLSGYFGRDKFYFRDNYQNDKYEAGIGWSNVTTTLRWNHLFSNKLFSNTSLIFSNYIFKIYNKSNSDGSEYNLKYYSGIRDFSLKYDLDYLPSTKHTLRFGMLSTFHTFTPSAKVFKDSYSGIDEKSVQSLHALETAVYGENIFKPFPKLIVNTGFRMSSFITQGQAYVYPEPRISMGYKLGPNVALKAGYSVMNQYLHLLSNTGIGLPTDLWVPSTKLIKPQRSQQVAAGITRDFIKQKSCLTIEAYYKTTKRVINYKEGASFLILDDPNNSSQVDWQGNVTAGRGWAYGVEVLLQKKVGKLSGWIGYTLSWTQLQFDSINFGKKFYARYDRRHDISVVAIYKITERTTLSGTWVYGTGNAITLPIAEYNAPSHKIGSGGYYNYGYYNNASEYTARNASRMPAYHRLDIGMQFHKKLTRNRLRTWDISVYNVYSRQNPFFYYLDSESVNGGYKSVLKQLSLFPIIPSISYQLKF